MNVDFPGYQWTWWALQLLQQNSKHFHWGSKWVWHCYGAQCFFLLLQWSDPNRRHNQNHQIGNFDLTFLELPLTLREHIFESKNLSFCKHCVTSLSSAAAQTLWLRFRVEVLSIIRRMCQEEWDLAEARHCNKFCRIRLSIILPFGKVCDLQASGHPKAWQLSRAQSAPVVNGTWQRRVLSLW